MFDPVALKMLADIPLPNLSGNIDNWQGSLAENVDYWNFSQRVDVNLTRQVEDLRALRPVQGQPLSAESRPTAGFFPLSGSNRDGMSIAGDAVWMMSNKTTLNVRGSFYNMIDEFYNPSLLLGDEGLHVYWPNDRGTRRSTTAATSTTPRST